MSLQPQRASRVVDAIPRLSTELDVFGLKKCFHSRESPQHDPDSGLTPKDLYDSTHHDDETELSLTDPSPLDATKAPVARPPPPSFGPFPNLSSFELGDWFYGQSGKSIRDFKALIAILKHPDFSIDDIRETKWIRIFQELGKNKEELNPKHSEWVDDAGWKTTPINIDVPVHRLMEGAGVEKHMTGTLFHRSIVTIVEEKIRNTLDARFFHHDGFELLWKPDSSDDASPEFRVLSELYHSDAFLQAQKEVRESPPPQIKDCALPRVVVGLMFWSDATQISTFSPKKLWPLYMLFGNESKHRRGKGTADPCNHVAYFDTVRCFPALSDPGFLLTIQSLSGIRLVTTSKTTSPTEQEGGYLRIWQPTCTENPSTSSGVSCLTRSCSKPLWRAL